MRCFIHIDVEAVATCRRCGKAMCANCSAYSNHSGICPECRKEDFENEVAEKKWLIKEQESEMSKRIWYAILTGITIIGIFYNVYKYNKAKELKETYEARIELLNAEITKLNGILVNRGGNAFI